MSIKRTFDADAKRFMASVEDLTKQRLQMIAERLFTMIVHNTPVRTGRLRGSWEIAVGDTPGESLPEEVRLSEDQAAATALEQLSSLEVELDKPIVISNSVPYAIYIEGGHGAKNAPGGMVASSVAAVVSSLGRDPG